MKAKAPIFTTSDGDRLLDPDKAEGGVLRYGVGDDIPEEEAKKLGLVDGAPPGAKAEDKADDKAEDKADKAAATKARAPAEDKGA